MEALNKSLLGKKSSKRTFIVGMEECENISEPAWKRGDFASPHSSYPTLMDPIQGLSGLKTGGGVTVGCQLVAGRCPGHDRGV